MKNKFLIAATILLVVSVGIFIGVKKNYIKPNDSAFDVNEVQDKAGEKATSSTASSVNNKVLGTKEWVWALLDEYVSAAKAHNIVAVKNLSYEQSDTCANKATENECFSLMDNVVATAQLIERDKYVNVWEDSKQVILTTEVSRFENDGFVGHTRGIIYLVKVDGKLKILSYNPTRTWFFVPRPGIDNEEFISNKLISMSLDSDSDGLTDEQEVCKGSYTNDSACTRTDPKKRDSDGDGWWDGIEFYFKNK